MQIYEQPTIADLFIIAKKKKKTVWGQNSESLAAPGAIFPLCPAGKCPHYFLPSVYISQVNSSRARTKITQHLPPRERELLSAVDTWNRTQETFVTTSSPEGEFFSKLFYLWVIIRCLCIFVISIASLAKKAL